MDDLEKLIAKLRKVETLRDGAATDGEQQAADRAHQKLLERLDELRDTESAVEYRFTFQDPWANRLFLAVCRYYKLRPYRYKGQRHTTVMLRVPESFVDETLWPMFERYNDILQDYLREMTDEVIEQVFDDDASGPDIVESLE